MHGKFTEGHGSSTVATKLDKSLTAAQKFDTRSPDCMKGFQKLM